MSVKLLMSLYSRFASGNVTVVVFTTLSRPVEVLRRALTCVSEKRKDKRAAPTYNLYFLYWTMHKMFDQTDRWKNNTWAEHNWLCCPIDRGKVDLA